MFKADGNGKIKLSVANFFSILVIVAVAVGSIYVMIGSVKADVAGLSGDIRELRVIVREQGKKVDLVGNDLREISDKLTEHLIAHGSP